MDESYDPLLNPCIRDLCREDPGIEIALRKRYPAAGSGDQNWAAATDEHRGDDHVPARVRRFRRRQA